MTYDDCIIVAGNTYSKDFDSVGFKGSNDFLVSKFDQSGNLLWHKCYGGSWTEVSSSICSTYDGGFIVVGSTTSKDGDVTENHGNRDFWIMKADIFGNLEWQKSLGGSNDDNANSVQQTSDGGYVVAGYTKSIDGDVIGANTTWDYWVVKLNNIGSIEWQKSLGGNSIEEGNSIQVTRDGGYIVAGTAYSIDGDVTGNHGIADYWVVKLSPENYDQSDVSDAVFSIVAPLATSQDIDMKQCLVGAVKDSIIQNLVQNIGSYKVRVDSIYFTGADADAFGLTSGLPVYELLPGENKATEVLFKPTKVGMHNATLNIVTQSETLKQSIIGEGIQQVLSFSTNLLDFGKVQLGDNKVFLDTALIKNNSNSLIEITDVVMLGPDNLQFNVVSGGGKFTLQPNEERKLDVMFRPIYSGRTSGQLGFVFNGFGSPAITQLFGQGLGAPTLRISSDSAEVGRRRYLQLMLGNMLPQGLSLVASNFEAKIRFQSTILAPVKYLDWYISNDSTFVTLKGNIDTSNVLAELYVRAGLGTVEETTIDIVEFKLLDNLGNIVDYEFEKYPGTFKLLGICKDGGTRLINSSGKAGIQSIAPNPAGNSIDLEFSTSEIGFTEIAIYNILGEKVLTVFTEDISVTGKRYIKINSGEIGNGTYMVIFKSPTVVDTKQIMIVK
jgi:hypothetical protein